MTFLNRFLGTETRDSTEKRSYSVSDLFLPVNTTPEVSTDTALTNTAVWGCIRILSDNIATLPVNVYEQDGDARLPLTPAPSWAGFSYGNNNRIDVLTQIMTSLLTDGNAYLATYRDSQGIVLFVEVLDPASVTPEFVDGQVEYLLAQADGTEAHLTKMDILHIKGLALPGTIEGLSPIKFHTATIGLSNAATDFGLKYFDNGTVPGGVISVEGEPSDASIKALKASWTQAHGGAGNSNKLAVLTQGMSFSKISANPNEAQFIDTRQFQISDIARIYGVPPHLLADASGSTSWGSGLAEQNTAFIQQSLRPWIERIELSFDWLLHSEGRASNVFVKLNIEGLLRGDFNDRMDGYVKGLQAGIYNIDEVRSKEDMPPLPDGAGLHHNIWSNTIPVDLQHQTAEANIDEKEAKADQAEASAAESKDSQ